MIYARENDTVGTEDEHSRHDPIKPADVVPWVLVITFGVALLGLCAASALLFIR